MSGLRLSRRELLRLGGGALAAGALGGLSSVGCGPRQSPVESSGYLLGAAASAALVGAVTASPQRLVLRWGRPGRPLERAVEEAEAGTFHRLQATDLEAGVTYAYRLERPDGTLVGEGTLRGARPAGEPCTLAVVGDTGGTETSRGALIDELDEEHERLRGIDGDENQQARVCAAMRARPADLILHTGDVVYPAGALSDYPEAFFRPFAPLTASRPILATVGNHDAKGGTTFDAVFCTAGEGPVPTGRARAVDWGDAHVVLLDNVATDIAPGSPQLEWAEESLRSTDRRWRIAVMHVPPIRATKPGTYATTFEEVLPALQRGGADLVLAGHDHTYARYFPMGRTTCVTTGGGGKDLYAVRADERLAYGESVFHFVELDLSPSRLVVRAIDAAGRTFDATTIER